MAGSSAELSISFDDVRAKAGRIRDLNRTLREKLNEFQRTVTSLDGKYISDTSTTIREKASALTPKFSKYEEDISAYAAFLDKVALTYQSMEGSLQANASTLYD